MQVSTMSAPTDEERAEAKQLWKDYCQILRSNTVTDAEYLKYYKTIKNAQYYLSEGKTLLDLEQSMRIGGLDPETGLPRLAIARADATEVRLRMWSTSMSIATDRWSEARDRRFIFRPETFGLEEFNPNRWGEFFAPVPKIPAPLYPEGSLERYHILWEVDEWKKVPPRDPLLLRRLEGSYNLYAVVAHWDLTELERAVMRGLL